jgi:hypothetical protein
VLAEPWRGRRTSQQTHPKAQTSDSRVRLKGRSGVGAINSGAIQRVEPPRAGDLIEWSKCINPANPKSDKRARPSSLIRILRWQCWIKKNIDMGQFHVRRTSPHGQHRGHEDTSSLG